MEPEIEPPIKEYFVDGMVLRASPKDILLLEKQKRDNPDLKHLLDAFENKREREAMNRYSWKWIDGQIEHRIKIMLSGIYFLVFGVRGMGKSEGLQTIGLRIIRAFLKFLNIEVDIGFGRNASDINTILADATTDNVVIMVLGDEAETERGMGANTEESALIDNLETIRVLGHSVGRATISYKKVRSFARQCDFILKTVYQDRKKRINWCILYVYDDEDDKLLPFSIIALPLHNDEELREIYEQIKKEEQLEFTMSRGRRGTLRKRLRPFSDILFNIAIADNIRLVRERDLEVKRWTELRPILLTDERIPAGDTLVDDEPKIACQSALLKLQAYFKDKPLDKEKDFAFEWGTEFTWRVELNTLIRKHGSYAKYYSFYQASEIDLLNPAKHSKEFTALTKKSQAVNYSWLRKMRSDDSFQGWIKDTRSILHEKYLADLFRRDGWEVTEKAKVAINDIEYEEDLFIKKGKLEFYINAKCGSGVRTYVKEEYTTTFLIKHTLKKEAFILYSDLETGDHFVFETLDRFQVGNGEGSIASTNNPKKFKNPSTPFLLALKPSSIDTVKKKPKTTKRKTKRAAGKGEGTKKLATKGKSAKSKNKPSKKTPLRKKGTKAKKSKVKGGV